MTKKIVNKDKVLMENAHFKDGDIDVYGFYGLTDFEIFYEEDCLSLDKDKFLTLYNLMSEMKKEIDRLEKI